MLFPQKTNTTAEGPKWVRMRQQIWHKSMAVNLSVIMFLMRAFYCVQMNPLCKLYIEPYGKNYQTDTDALNKYVVQ